MNRQDRSVRRDERTEERSECLCACPHHQRREEGRVAAETKDNIRLHTFFLSLSYLCPRSSPTVPLLTFTQTQREREHERVNEVKIIPRARNGWLEANFPAYCVNQVSSFPTLLSTARLRQQRQSRQHRQTGQQHNKSRSVPIRPSSPVSVLTARHAHTHRGKETRRQRRENGSEGSFGGARSHWIRMDRKRR